MATSYKIPGIYIEETPLRFPAITPGETAVPAFIGYTQKAQDLFGKNIHLQPTRITSFTEYTTLFGQALAESIHLSLAQQIDGTGKLITESISVALQDGGSPHILAYALRAYFANGGGACYIVSVGAYKRRGKPLLVDELQAGLNSVAHLDVITLIVIPEAQRLVPSAFYSLQNEALAQCAQQRNRFCIMDVCGADKVVGASAELMPTIAAFRDGLTSPHLKYGAVYFPNLYTTIPVVYTDKTVTLNHRINGVAAPFNGKSLAAILPLNTELYNRLKAAVSALCITMPPSPFVAGVYAKMDRERGVWKAPANLALNLVHDVFVRISDGVQQDLNVDVIGGKSINAIRMFTGKGTLVWGARTLAGNDNEWRYVPVRRLFNWVESACKQGLKQCAMEGNNASTWANVENLVYQFLLSLWRQGALQGTKSEHAFFVWCGLGKTMTTQDVANGRLIVEIGLAVIRAAEFVVVRITQQTTTD